MNKEQNLNNADNQQLNIAGVRRSTYSYDEYQGHDNESIISLNDELNNCKAELRRIEKEIETIQNNCTHEYMFVCRGMYEDSYTCKKCGHDTVH